MTALCPSPLSQGLGPALANENFVRTTNVDLASFLHFVVYTVNRYRTRVVQFRVNRAR